MCGISGIIYLKEQSDKQLWIEKMTNLIEHRGPDSFGYFNDGPLYFGHRRLSIIDMSDAAIQPMSRNDVTITYNGEIYNYIELRKELEGYGITFQTSSDTEVIIEAYKFWGEDCVHHFNGMWAFAIYDKPKGKLFCSRDRFGIKPFVYTLKPGYIAFASEMKQLTILPEFEPIINEKIVFDFFEHQLLNHSEETFFSDIRELRGGYNLKIDTSTNAVTIEKWYEIPSRSLPKSYAEQVNEFRSLFIDSLKLIVRSDVRVGSCLSGGMDSSSIVSGVIFETDTDSMTSVSSCFHQSDIDESEFIDAVTAATGVENKKIYPDLDDLKENDLFKKMIYHQDQPFFGLSHFSEYSVFKEAARNKLVVMLDGQGADEYLYGYSQFVGLYLRNLLAGKKVFKYLKTLFQLSGLRGQRNLKFFKMRILTDLRAESTQSGSGFIREGFRNKFPSPAPLKNVSLKALSRQQLFESSIPYQLHSEDRNSMMHSIESRLPFLDYRLVEYGFNLGDSSLLRNGKTKAILRDAMKGIVTDKVIDRHNKLGFPCYDEIWLRENEAFILPLLKSAVHANSHIFNESLVESYKEYVEGKSNYESDWVKVISYDLWKQAFNMKYA